MASNVTHKIVGNKLVIEVDLSDKSLKAAPPSKSGKTNLVATTHGSVNVAEFSKANISYSLNCMVKE